MSNIEKQVIVSQLRKKCLKLDVKKRECEKIQIVLPLGRPDMYKAVPLSQIRDEQFLLSKLEYVCGNKGRFYVWTYEGDYITTVEPEMEYEFEQLVLSYRKK